MSEVVRQIEDGAMWAAVEAVGKAQDARLEAERLAQSYRELAEHYAEEIKAAHEDRDQARDLAMELENCAAQWERVVLAWAPLVSGYCSKDSTRKTARGSHVACSLPAGHDKGCVFIPTVDGWADQ